MGRLNRFGWLSMTSRSVDFEKLIVITVINKYFFTVQPSIIGDTSTSMYENEIQHI